LPAIAHFGALREWQRSGRRVRRIDGLLFGEPVRWPDWPRTLSNAAQALAGDAAWRGPDGPWRRNWLGCLQASEALISWRCSSRMPYRCLRQLLDARAVGRPGANPRIFIWGLLEARLQRADQMVLGGLNEGTWPALVRAPDPWLPAEGATKWALPRSAGNHSHRARLS